MLLNSLFKHTPSLVAIAHGHIAISVNALKRSCQAPAFTLNALVGQNNIVAVKVWLSWTHPVFTGRTKLKLSIHLITHNFLSFI